MQFLINVSIFEQLTGHDDGQVVVTGHQCHGDTGDYSGQDEVPGASHNSEQCIHDDVECAGFCYDAGKGACTECDVYDTCHELIYDLGHEFRHFRRNGVRIEAFFCDHGGVKRGD